MFRIKIWAPFQDEPGYLRKFNSISGAVNPTNIKTEQDVMTFLKSALHYLSNGTALVWVGSHSIFCCGASKFGEPILRKHKFASPLYSYVYATTNRLITSSATVLLHSFLEVNV